MDHPLVSILITAYNAGPWYAETLASATGQTWPEIGRWVGSELLRRIPITL